MRSVPLPGGGRTSALGFGCAALVGGRTRKDAIRLLDAAFDAGIRHFDVARVYGTGDAEEILGAFARSRPHEVTIATKFGIDPLPPTRSVDVAKRVVRGVARRWPGFVTVLRRQTGRVVTRGNFSPEKARSSLEVSLGRLGVGRVDLYLLHDCTPDDWSQAALRDELSTLVSDGRIGAYGPATGRQAAAGILALPGPSPAVIQSQASILEPPLRSPDVPLSVTFGSLRLGLEQIAEHLAREDAVAARWTAELGLDITAPGELAPLLIAEALEANSGGIVLFSAGSERHIARCASAASTAAPPEQLAALRRLAAELR